LGVIKGSISYSRFFVWGDLPERFQERFVRSVKNRAFEPLNPQEPDDEHMGWVSVDDPFDVDLGQDTIFNNDYLNVALRIDRWRIPAPIFKAHFAEAESEYLERKGREKLSKREKDDLKALVTRRLRKQVLPAMKVIDLSWHLDSGILRFWSNTSKMHERLHEIFEKTFKLKLVPESPYTKAIWLGASERQAKAFTNLEVSAFHGLRAGGR